MIAVPQPPPAVSYRLKKRTPEDTARCPRRFSREESQAQTRARLVEVGRKHFLKYGLGNAVAEKIAEEAGYSRGALYSNFTGKEDLFLAVIEEEYRRHCKIYTTISQESVEPEVLLERLRAAYIKILVDPDWVILWADFQSEGVRNEIMREQYREFHTKIILNAVRIISGPIEDGRLICRMEPADFVLAMSSFSHGLAMRQRLLGSKLPEKATRKLIREVFDTLISSERNTCGRS